MKKLLPLLLISFAANAELNELNHDRLYDFANMVPVVKSLAEECYSKIGKLAKSSASCAEFREEFIKLSHLKTQTDRINQDIRYKAIANSNKLYKAFKKYDYIEVLRKNKSQMRRG